GKRVPEGFHYSSDNNTEWMSPEDLQQWLIENAEKVGNI
ncbi:UDP-N-acetylglucosamine 4,6-dehydratase (inverting), partial [Acinetobacter baumannii]|nr:UDP-N-acetylglucosamine 4,6-dehydratase (inverting) [Acinetobacter baumannii]